MRIVSGFKRLQAAVRVVWERMFVVRGGVSLTLSYVRLDARLLSEHTQTHTHTHSTHTPALHPLFFSLLLQGAVTDCAFSPSGETIASGSKDGSVRLWTPTVKVTRSEAPSHMTAHMTAHSTLSTLSTHGAQGTHNTTMLPQTTLPHSARVYTMVVFLCIRGSFGSLLTTN